MPSLFLHFPFECVESRSPKFVEVVSQSVEAARVQSIDAACAANVIQHEFRVFEDFEVLRDGRAAYRKAVREFAHGHWPLQEPIENSAARGISQCVELDLLVSFHLP